MTISTTLPALTLLLAAAGDPAEASSAYLGVHLAPEIPEAVAAHLGIDGGAMVTHVVPASPAAQAGLKKHDVVVAAGGKAVQSAQDLSRAIQERTPGETLALSVRRGAETLEVSTKLAARAETDDGPGEKKPGFLGVRYTAVPESLRVHLRLGENEGILVEEALPDSPASKAGIERHDIILSVGGERITARGGVRSWPPAAPVPPGHPGGDAHPGAPGGDIFTFGPSQGSQDASNFPEVIGRHAAGETVELELIHQGERKSVRVELAERPVTHSPPPPRSFAPSPFGVPGRPAPFGVPHSSTRGKLIFKDSQGKEHVIEFPRLDGLQEDFLKTWRRHLGALEHVPDDIVRRLDDVFDDLDLEVDLDLELDAPADGDAAGRSGYSAFSSTSVVTAKDGEYEITVRDDNGHRTASIKKGDQVLADELPFEKLDTLPEDLQERVKKLARKLRTAHPGARLELRLPDVELFRELRWKGSRDEEHEEHEEHEDVPLEDLEASGSIKA